MSSGNLLRRDPRVRAVAMRRNCRSFRVRVVAAALAIGCGSGMGAARRSPTAQGSPPGRMAAWPVASGAGDTSTPPHLPAPSATSPSTTPSRRVAAAPDPNAPVITTSGADQFVLVDGYAYWMEGHELRRARPSSAPSVVGKSDSSAVVLGATTKSVYLFDLVLRAIPIAGGPAVVVGQPAIMHGRTIDTPVIVGSDVYYVDGTEHEASSGRTPTLVMRFSESKNVVEKIAEIRRESDPLVVAKGSEAVFWRDGALTAVDASGKQRVLVKDKTPVEDLLAASAQNVLWTRLVKSARKGRMSTYETMLVVRRKSRKSPVATSGLRPTLLQVTASEAYVLYRLSGTLRRVDLCFARDRRCVLGCRRRLRGRRPWCGLRGRPQESATRRRPSPR